MADKAKNEELKGKVDDGRSLEEIQKEIALVELETKKMQLARSKRDNELFQQAEETRHKNNRQRMAELKAGRESAEAIVNACRHKSGGGPANPLRGGGIGSFSTITRSIMPDGVTLFLQCPRCRMKEYFRLLTAPEESKLRKGNPEMYDRYKKSKKLYEISIEDGLEHAEMRGPTFMFQNSEGVPIIPDRV